MSERTWINWSDYIIKRIKLDLETEIHSWWWACGGTFPVWAGSQFSSLWPSFFFFLNSNFLILECSCLHGLGFLLTSDTSHTQQKGSAVVVNSCNQSVWTLYHNTPLFLRNNCLLSLQERRGRRCSSQHSGGLHVLSIQRFVCRHFSGGILPDWTQRHQQEVRLTAAFTVFQSKHRPWPPCLGVSDPQVLLQRHSSVGHFERRRGATARVFWPLPHPGGIHWGLHGRLDQQKYAFHGIRGCYFIEAPHSGKRLAHFLCVWSFQSSGPPSRPPAPPQLRASASHAPPAAYGDSDAFEMLLLLMMQKVHECFCVFRLEYWKEKCALPKYFQLQVWDLK